MEAVASAEQVLERSLPAARRLAAMGPAFGVTKRQLRADVEARIERLATLDADVDAVWQDVRTLERMRS